MTRADPIADNAVPVRTSAMMARAWRWLGDSLLEGRPSGLLALWSSQWLVVVAVVGLLYWTWR